MPESFDEAFPGGFEECVRTLSNEDSVDDPEKLCGWLQEHGFEALKETNPTDVLVGLEVEYVSVVDEPAQDSEWLIAKSADADPDAFDPSDNSLREGEFVVRKEGDDEEPERKVWAAVLIPGEVDKQGDLVPEPEIERAAHNYLKHYRKVDEDHSLLEGSGEPIESYIAPEELTFDLPDGSGSRTYPEGTWIMGVELTEQAWKRVESGELSGFSIYGGAASLEPRELLTEKQEEVLLSMDDDPDGDEQVEKEVDPDDLADAVQAFLDATGADPESVSLSDFFAWVQENQNPDEDGEESEDDEADDDSDEEEQESSAKDQESGNGDSENESEQEKENMGDENPDDDVQDEQNEKLDELLETTKSVEKSVSNLDDRVEELEEEVFEKDADDEETEEATDDLDEETVEEVAENAAKSAAEEVLKSAFDVDEDDAEDSEDLSEVVRKGSAFPDPDHDEEQDDGLNLDYSGITEGV